MLARVSPCSTNKLAPRQPDDLAPAAAKIKGFWLSDELSGGSSKANSLVVGTVTSEGIAAVPGSLAAPPFRIGARRSSSSSTPRSNHSQVFISHSPPISGTRTIAPALIFGCNSLMRHLICSFCQRVRCVLALASCFAPSADIAAGKSMIVSRPSGLRPSAL